MYGEDLYLSPRKRVATGNPFLFHANVIEETISNRGNAPQEGIFTKEDMHMSMTNHARPSLGEKYCIPQT
jgi:hypothetical protein